MALGNSRYAESIIDDTKPSKSTAYSSARVQDIISNILAGDSDYIQYIVCSSDIAPTNPSKDDKYYNTLTNLIHKFDGTNWNAGELPVKNTIYVDTETNEVYISDGIVLKQISGTSSVQNYQENTEYEENSLIQFGNKLCIALINFTSTDLGNEQDSFEDDIKKNYLLVINSDHMDVIYPYGQNNYYQKNSLVYLDKLIYRVAQDFTSDQTQANIEDSIKVDETAGNLILLNKEAEPGILPYKQGTFFLQDKLVFADGRIGRVLNDYISNSTGQTLEESINIDIANGNLREMADNYRFKLYKTSKDMSKVVDDINELPIATIQFENGETVDNMRVHEAVYGPLGTLSIIQEIDKNTGIIKTKTVTSREVQFMPPAPEDYEFTIELPGAGFTVGEILPTNISGINVEVTQVGPNGDILQVARSDQQNLTRAGAGGNISAKLKLYLGSGKAWVQMPEQEQIPLLLEYVPGNSYVKDNLIFLGDVLARASQDFTANATAQTAEESFAIDRTNGYLIRMTREDVSVPECLGSVKTDDLADLPANPVKGNWVLIDNCKNSAPDQAGIGLYNGTSWDISPIPQGTFQFPEPNDDDKLYFRQRESGQTDGQWVSFESVDGNTVTMNIRQLSDTADNQVVPAKGELIWDTSRRILVIGDGTTNLGGLKEFYEKKDDNPTLGTASSNYEELSNKGQANGYAPLDASGIVPLQNLPKNLTDTYSKSEIDTKEAALTNSVTGLVNIEASRAKAVETQLQTDITNHVNDTVIHVTQTDRDAWDAKVDEDSLEPFENHLLDDIIHVTQEEKDKWDGMQKAFYVEDAADLPTEDVELGNMGYVQLPTSVQGVVAVQQYIYDGTAWNQVDTNQVTLQMKWGNIADRPSATPLTIDNAVTVAHSHNNKSVLDKIGQSAAGNFTYDGIEIGVKVVFYETEKLLPSDGDEDTLYVIYKDARTRNYPSVSVYKDGAYQILGRGAQENAPVVGDMNILQAEYYSVSANSTYNITFSPNQYFAFMPMEILKEIEGLKNQTRVMCDASDPENFKYNENILTVNNANKCTINIRSLDATLDTVSDYYYYHCDVDLSDYKDIDSIE